MFKYLNGVYPTAYIYRCKFGEVLYLDDGMVVDNHYHIRRREVVVQLVSLFTCEESYANYVFDNWRASRPVYVRSVNSTNDDVLVSITTELNTTVQYLYHMKYIITEEQYFKLPENEKALFWIRRRFNRVEEELKGTFELMEFDICRIDNYDKFENKFFSVLMDGLHPYFYDDPNIDNIAYDAMLNILKDLFYVECTEFYADGREKC